MRRTRKPINQINVVPYIDVMLVLLVIFMVTAPILQQGVQIDLLKASIRICLQINAQRWYKHSPHTGQKQQKEAWAKPQE